MTQIVSRLAHASNTHTYKIKALTWRGRSENMRRPYNNTQSVDKERRKFNLLKNRGYNSHLAWEIRPFLPTADEVDCTRHVPSYQPGGSNKLGNTIYNTTTFTCEGMRVVRFQPRLDLVNSGTKFDVPRFLSTPKRRIPIHKRYKARCFRRNNVICFRIICKHIICLCNILRTETF